MSKDLLQELSNLRLEMERLSLALSKLRHKNQKLQVSISDKELEISEMRKTISHLKRESVNSQGLAKGTYSIGDRNELLINKIDAYLLEIDSHLVTMKR